MYVLSPSNALRRPFADRALRAGCGGDPPSLARRRPLTARRLPSLPGRGGWAPPSSRCPLLRCHRHWRQAAAAVRRRERRLFSAAAATATQSPMTLAWVLSYIVVAGRCCPAACFDLCRCWAITFRFSSTKIMREENADGKSVDWTKIAIKGQFRLVSAGRGWVFLSLGSAGAGGWSHLSHETNHLFVCGSWRALFLSCKTTKDEKKHLLLSPVSCLLSPVSCLLSPVFLLLLSSSSKYY